MSDALKVFTDLFGQLGKLPIAVVIALVAIALGLVLKKANFFPNRFIPLVTLTFCSVAYAFLGDVSAINPNQRYPQVILAFYGILLGFVSWGAHKFVLKRLEKFLPEGFFPAGSFDTDEFSKPNPPNTTTDGTPKGQ